MCASTAHRSCRPTPPQPLSRPTPGPHPGAGGLPSWVCRSGSPGAPVNTLAGKRKSRHRLARVETGKNLERNTPTRRSIEISLAFRPQCRTGLRCGPSAASFASVSDRNLETDAADPPPPRPSPRHRGRSLSLTTAIVRPRQPAELARCRVNSCAEGAPSPQLVNTQRCTTYRKSFYDTSAQAPIATRAASFRAISTSDTIKHFIVRAVPRATPRTHCTP